MKPRKAARHRRLKKIRCLLMDVDGVLTDGKLHFTSDGNEFKTFDVQDGHGIAMAQRAGLTIGFISGRPSKATERRAADLGVKIVLQQPTNKMDMVERVKRQHGLTDEQICFIGDELVDLPVLRRAGFAVAVPNAMDEVKRAAHYVTRCRGGDGAVREVIEMILKAQGLWKKVIAKYLTLALTTLLVTGGSAAAGNGTHAPAREEATGFIEKFEVPERDEAGNLRWKLSGEKAQIRSDGVMNIINARAEFYSSNKVDLVFSAPACVLDRLNKRAETDAPVRIERANMVVTGNGAEWTDETSTFIVRSNVRVVLSGGTALFTKPEEPQ
jgi:3-deoxy-D-manno-octulosonate 8-phosphate phosphatase (KDO 8-P phosphatase)